MNNPIPLASAFLLIISFFFLLLYALPLLLVPLRWARWLRWQLPAGGAELTVYLGRCVGGLALAVILMALRAAPDPRGHRLIFELIATIAAIMTAVHLWGALRRVQPWTETAEIALYAVVTGLSGWFSVAVAG